MTDRDEHLEAQLRARPLPGLSDEARRRLLADLASATMAAPSGAVMDGVGPAETVAPVAEGIRESDVPPITTITLQRARQMKRIAKFAVASTILAALGTLIGWIAIGGGVKLGAPDRPIFWYKPTGAEKYRVFYADLSVKDMAADDVKKLPEAKTK